MVNQIKFGINSHTLRLCNIKDNIMRNRKLRTNVLTDVVGL